MQANLFPISQKESACVETSENKICELMDRDETVIFPPSENSPKYNGSSMIEAIPRLIQVGRRDWPGMVETVPPWKSDRRLECNELWYLWRGRGNIRHHDQNLFIKSGNLIWMEPGVTYRIRQDPQHPMGVTFLRFELLDEDENIVKLNRTVPTVMDPRDTSLTESLTRRIVELYWESYIDSIEKHEPVMPWTTMPQIHFVNGIPPDPISPICPQSIGITPNRNMEYFQASRHAECLFKGLLAEISHQLDRRPVNVQSGLEKHHRDIITSVVLQIRKDPRNIRSVESMAMEVGYSSDHFTRTFKKVMGCPPQQFLMTVRIAHAKELLLKTGLSIKEISKILGYHSAYFFSRQFKELTSQTPSRFRSTLV